MPCISLLVTTLKLEIDKLQIRPKIRGEVGCKKKLTMLHRMMDSYSVAAEDTLVADTLVEGILEVGSYPAEGILAVGNPEVDNPEADNLEELHHHPKITAPSNQIESSSHAYQNKQTMDEQIPNLKAQLLLL